MTHEQEKNTYFKNIVEDINKVKRLKNKPHSQTVKKLGMTINVIYVLFEDV